MRRPAVSRPQALPTASAPTQPRIAGGVGALLVGLCALLVGFDAAGAAPDPNGRPRTPIYRCEGGGTATFSDTPQRCPTGQASADMATPGASAVTISGPTARLSRTGPPCPLPVRDPEGPAWNSLRMCFSRFLETQPDRLASESQMAGAAMGECDAETLHLSNGKDHVNELGINPAERRQSIKLWAQWLVRSMGKAADSVAVETIRSARPLAISRLTGPVDQQWPDGSVTEAVGGTVVPPGNQLYVRRGVSFWLGGTAVLAQAKQERCVKLE